MFEEHFKRIILTYKLCCGQHKNIIFLLLNMSFKVVLNNYEYNNRIIMQLLQLVKVYSD